ncbi:MAG: tetratricopeptide repeat protein [Planctomycetota bacterium]|nr:tetratricopeptide repeat protein [Planctomycetota bacterium]
MGEEGVLKHLALGIFYQDMGYSKDALQQLEYVLKVQPENKTALVYSALAYAQEGDYAEAEGRLKKALSIDSSYAPTYSAFATIFFRRNFYDEAEFYANHTLQLAPNDKQALLLLGDLNYQRKKLQYALIYYERAVAAHPEDSQARMKCATCLAALGRFQDALYELRRANEIEPSRVEIHIALGEMYEKIGDRQKAVEHFESAVTLAPNDLRLLRRLATIHERASNLHIASQYYKKILLLNPSDYETMRLLAHIRMRQKAFPEALRLYKQILEILPDDGESNVGIAKAYAALGNTELETEHLRRAVLAHPSSASALFALARSALKRGRYDEALRSAKKLLAIMPTDSRVLELVADINFKMGDEEEALFNYQRAIISGCRKPALFYRTAELLLHPSIVRTLGVKQAEREISRYLKEALRLDTKFESIPLSLRNKVYHLLSKEDGISLGRALVYRRFFHRLLPTESILFENALIVRRGFGRFRTEKVLPLRMLSPKTVRVKGNLTLNLLFFVAIALLSAFVIKSFSVSSFLSVGSLLVSLAALLNALKEWRGSLVIADSATGEALVYLPTTPKAFDLVNRLSLLLSKPNASK